MNQHESVVEGFSPSTPEKTPSLTLAIISTALITATVTASLCYLLYIKVFMKPDVDQMTQDSGEAIQPENDSSVNETDDATQIEGNASFTAPTTKNLGGTEYRMYEGQATVTGEYSLAYGLGTAEILGFTADAGEATKLPQQARKHVGLVFKEPGEEHTEDDKERMYQLFFISTELRNEVGADWMNCAVQGRATIVIRDVYETTAQSHAYPTTKLVQVLSVEAPKLHCVN